MTVIVFGLDALDPDLVSPEEHPNLTLDAHRPIETINSTAGEPSTHELWPSIITGLPPSEHGLVLDDGVAWENPVLGAGSRLADYLLPDSIQTRIGAWLLTNTDADAFRVPSSYYDRNGIETIFDGRSAKPIGIPNYVLDSDSEDREHQLRRNMGDLFERDPDAVGGHVSSNPDEFYERCLEMSMIRIARTRRALRSRDYELVFGYTSGLDLVGHVSYDRPSMQRRAYDELDEFIGELRADLTADDELVLVSDHGLQEGLHTQEAMVAATRSDLVTNVNSVLDVRDAVERALTDNRHETVVMDSSATVDGNGSGRVREQLEDLGYI